MDDAEEWRPATKKPAHRSGRASVREIDGQPAEEVGDRVVYARDVRRA